MNVIIEIEELVLHGFSTRDRYAIAEAVERELARLVAERPSFLKAVQLDSNAWAGKVLTGQFVLSHGAQGEAVGVAAGQAVFKALEAV